MAISSINKQKHYNGQPDQELSEQKIPSRFFFWAAFASMGGSLAMQIMNRRDESMFVGQWVPSLLILGTYFQLKKKLTTTDMKLSSEKKAA